MLPLDGVTVIAVEQAVAAPFATRQLADMGARVIKIERPSVGDFARGYDTAVRGMASHFVWLNRSKESLTLDLKRPEAQGILRRLLARADVFIHNLAPGAIDRLGFGAGALRAEEGVRPADSERSRSPVDYRHERHAVQGGYLDRGHCRRHVRVHVGADRALRARENRRGR